jgi:nitroimidazol reductase NimA-like FMN-containing flavoprotein (pyridoxamine 5'-phosphate oxidase superfamily)
MEHNDGPVQELSETESWQLLGRSSFGRLAVSAAGEIDIFPINYYADGSTILMRTAPGTKLVEMTINSSVAFEVDGVGETEAWSVVVKGSARWLDTRAEIDAADRQPLTSWIPTLKYVYVRITPTEVNGRRFHLGDEPDRI